MKISNAVKFSREVKQEGRKVTWPERKEVITTTIIVLIMVTLVSLFLLFSDWIISGAIEFILGTGS